MPGYILDSGATIKCPHGGQATVVTSATHMKLGGSPPILPTDTVTISGCSFNISGSPSPCMTVKWQMPALKVKTDNTAVLLSNSIGLCMSAAQAPQGPATVSGYQTKVKAQ